MTSCLFVASEEQDEERLDRFLSSLLTERSRTGLQRLIKDGHVSVNGEKVKPSCGLHAGDEIRVELPDPEQLSIEAQDIPINIVYEDEDLLVVNKPQGMVVHPAPGHYSGTLVNALLYHCRDLSGINGVLRPGIVHRIDRDTSGLLLVCKNDAAHRHIAQQLMEHSIERVYQALALGRFRESEGTVDAPIGRDPWERKKMCVHKDTLHAKTAVTHYRVLKQYKDIAHIACRLETGRTHQIRVHMSYIGHAILGDPVYGPSKMPFSSQTKGQALHAGVLGFVHPRSGEKMHFEAPLPDNFAAILTQLEKEG